MPANRIKLEPAIERRYARKAQRRKSRQIVCKILIVCEGTKTEPNYFEAFKTFNGGTIVYDIDVRELGQNTTDVVDKAIELKSKGDYDRVWAVFDKDSFSANKFNGAIIKAQNNGIGCAWSNEAMEDAVRFAEAKSREYTDQRYAAHNPCTMVFKLVWQLTGRDGELNLELKNKIEG